MSKIIKHSFYLFVFVILFIFVSVRYSTIEAQGKIPTEQNFKVAFVGDTGDDDGFQAVLNLIKAEGADLVMHQGDFSYNGTATWTNQINSTLGSNFPYLGASGNHDDWSDYYPFFRDRFSKMGLDVGLMNGNDSNYAFTYKGLKIVFNREKGDANFSKNNLEGDEHIWKICSWHQNRNDFQAGGKGNEVDLQTYRNCLDAGAIIATGHEHSYSRTCSLTDPGSGSESNKYGANCSQPNIMQVGNNKSFIFVSGLGGTGRRDYHDAEHDDDGWWSTIYTSDRYCKGNCTRSDLSGQNRSNDIVGFNYNYGALFIEFYVDGDPFKAKGYFKNIDGEIIDNFTIQADGGGFISPTPTSIKKQGDANGDGRVDGIDFSIWLNHYNTTTGNGSGDGDFNNNGRVDGVDFSIWLNNYGT